MTIFQWFATILVNFANPIIFVTRSFRDFASYNTLIRKTKKFFLNKYNAAIYQDWQDKQVIVKNPANGLSESIFSHYPKYMDTFKSPMNFSFASKKSNDTSILFEISLKNLAICLAKSILGNNSSTRISPDIEHFNHKLMVKFFQKWKARWNEYWIVSLLDNQCIWDILWFYDSRSFWDN